MAKRKSADLKGNKHSSSAGLALPAVYSPPSPLHHSPLPSSCCPLPTYFLFGLMFFLCSDFSCNSLQAVTFFTWPQAGSTFIFRAIYAYFISTTTTTTTVQLQLKLQLQLQLHDFFRCARALSNCSSSEIMQRSS